MQFLGKCSKCSTLALGHFDPKLLPVVIKKLGLEPSDSQGKKKKDLTIVEAKLCEVLCFEKCVVCLDYPSSVSAGEFTQCLKISVLRALQSVRVKVSVN